MLRPTIARSGWRAATRGSAQARPLPFAPAAKRFASSSAKEEAKSDLPWIISSVALFGSVGFYMTTPSKKSAHHAAPKERQQRLPSLPLPDDDPQPKAEEASDDDQDEAAEDDSGPSGPAGEAGEGKPHGTGDNHLRELSQNSDEHSTKQKSKGEAKDLQPNPHKMDEARKQAVSSDNENSLSTKKVVAEANTRHDDEKGQKAQQKSQKEEKSSDDKE